MNRLSILLCVLVATSLSAKGIDDYRDIIKKMGVNKMCTIKYDCIDMEEYWIRGDDVVKSLELPDDSLSADTAYKKGLIYYKADMKEEAGRYFTIAEQKGSRSGAFANGMNYMDKGEPQKAIDSFLKASLQNDHKSLLKLSMLFPDREFEFLSKSALNGNPEALMRIGVILMKGSDKRIPQNDILALSIFNFLGAGSKSPYNEDVFIGSVLQARFDILSSYKNTLESRMGRSEIKEARVVKWMPMLGEIVADYSR